MMYEPRVHTCCICGLEHVEDDMKVQHIFRGLTKPMRHVYICNDCYDGFEEIEQEEEDV